MRALRSRRWQRGFLYLSTGGNGTGKTLFTLHDVRKLQLETGRPVFYNGFTAKQPLLDFGWQTFEPAKWRDLPDGSICIIDECQEVMPTRSVGKPPEWIEAIAKDHRKRGFDFFLITQHPLNFDSFIRRLIASPGWHRHFKASTMTHSSNELKWATVIDQPQKNNSGASGEVTPRPFPKEVYDWYESASVHTAKRRIPLKVWGALLGVIAAPLLIGFAVSKFIGSTDSMSKAKGQSSAASILTGPAKALESGGEKKASAMTADEYIQSRSERIPGFPHTAPVYDSVTAPVVAPYPAACVSMGSKCRCYTQQGTVLATDMKVCLQIVQRGFFVDWQQPQQQQPAQPVPVSARAADPAPAPVQASIPPKAEKQPQFETWSQALARRNAQVRSAFDDASRGLGAAGEAR